MKCIIWLRCIRITWLSGLFLFPVAPLLAQEFNSSHLPIVVIETNGTAILDEPKVVVQMGIISNPDGINRLTDPFNDYNGKIGIEFRGNSTQLFGKKSYSIELRDENDEDIDASLLGLPEEEDWILYGSPIDKTHLRNVMTFELWRKMGYWASRTRYCELVLDGEYRGIYILMEKVKKDDNRLAIATLRANDLEGNELTGGYIIRMDWPEGDGWRSKYNSMGGEPLYFQYYYPRAENIQPAQRLYIREYINDFEEALFSDNFRNRNGDRYNALIDIYTFADLFIINELSRSVDAYKISSFIHKDKGGILKAGPVWDFNLAFGNVVYCGGSKVSGWTYKQLDSECDDLFLMPVWWERMMEDIFFRKAVHCRWQAYRQDFLNEGFLFDFIDQQVDLLGSSVDRNFEKWNYLGDNLWDEPEPILDTYEEEVDRLKAWLTDRMEWLDGQLDEECDVTGLNHASGSIKIFPNPSRSSVHITFTGIRNVSLLLTDLSGRVVMTMEGLNENVVLTDFGSLPNGIYLVYLMKNDFLHIEAVVKN